MEVPRRIIDGYNDMMGNAVAEIQDELRASLALIDYSRPIGEVRAEVVALMDAYCDASASVGARLSSEFYNGLRELATGKTSVLSLQTGRSPAATESAVKAFVEKLLEGDIEGFEDLLLERVELEAKRAAAYNTIDNVRNDPDRPRFARVPQGEKTCDFCLMLASRGPVYLTAESAGAFVKYHAHCDCKVVPFWGTVDDGPSRRRSISMSVEGYDPDALYDRYLHPEKYKDAKESTSTEESRWKSDERKQRELDINNAIKSVKPVFISPRGNEQLVGNISRIEGEQGWYDVHAHGQPGSIQVFSSDDVLAKDLAHIITSRDDYHGEPIRLFACHSAEEDAEGRCMGRDLAGIMKVDVRAAPGRTYIRADGTYWFEHTGDSEFIEFRGGGDDE